MQRKYNEKLISDAKSLGFPYKGSLFYCFGNVFTVNRASFFVRDVTKKIPHVTAVFTINGAGAIKIMP